MKQIMKKMIKYLPFVFMGMFFLGFMFVLPLEAFDEIWNFQNVFKMYNGYELYTDCNAIVTPVFYYLGLGFLKIFGGHIRVLRLLNVIVYICYFIIFNLILKKLGMSKHLRCVVTSMLLLLISRSLNGGVNYNIVGVTLMMLGILLYLHYEDKKGFHFIQGALIFIIFLTKQNLGVFYAASILLYELWCKKEILKYIADQLKKFIIFAIGTIITVLIYYANGNLYDFINYTFGGLLDFGTKNLAFSTSIYLIGFMLASLVVAFSIIILKPKGCSDIFMKNLKLLTAVAIGATLFCYPLFNEGHALHIIGFYFLIFFYFIDYAMLEDVFTVKEFEIKTYLVSSIIIFVLVIRFVVVYFELQESYEMIRDENSPFNMMYFGKEDYNKINTMKKYVEEKNKEGKDVLILTSDACMTNLTLNKYNGELDLPFVGNLGYKGEENVIEKIKKIDNTEILIFTDKDDCFWQESELIRNYIIDNLEKKGEVLNYSIYE